MKKVLISLGFLAALCGSPSSFAQLPVFDASEVFSTERAWLKVLDEVRVACKAKDTASVYVWTPNEFTSRKDLESYSSDKKKASRTPNCAASAGPLRGSEGMSKLAFRSLVMPSCWLKSERNKAARRAWKVHSNESES